MAAVLVVHGTVDGKEAAVGLDSFAGMGMVTAETVRDSEQEWEPTEVRLQGVAEEAVQPLGEIEMQVKLVEGVEFCERAAICEQLPGGADVLISHDTLREQGLLLGREEVRVGGQGERGNQASAQGRKEDVARDGPALSAARVKRPD